MEGRGERNEGRKALEDRLNEERELEKLKTVQEKNGKQRRHLISTFSSSLRTSLSL